MIRVELPHHLRTLARVNGEVEVQVEGSVTQRAILDAVESKYPMLRGTIRDHVTQLRRPCYGRDRRRLTEEVMSDE